MLSFHLPEPHNQVQVNLEAQTGRLGLLRFPCLTVSYSSPVRLPGRLIFFPFVFPQFQGISSVSSSFPSSPSGVEPSGRDSDLVAPPHLPSSAAGGTQIKVSTERRRSYWVVGGHGTRAILPLLCRRRTQLQQHPITGRRKEAS